MPQAPSLLGGSGLLATATGMGTGHPAHGLTDFKT